MTEDRLDWFVNARFGLFVHYGLFSLLERSEWVLNRERIPLGEYLQLADRFTAENFDANALCDLAVEVGMKYVNLTTMHHDGFRLYDMRITGVKIMGTGGAVTPNYTSQPADMFTFGPEPATPPPGSAPGASLEYPLAGGQIDARTLNSRKYIDVMYTDYSGMGLDYATIQDTDPEFTFAGTGVGDVAISYVEQLDGGNTFRYHLADGDPSNDVDLFKAGGVTVQFTAGTWKDLSGKANTATSASFTVIDGGGTATTGVSLGGMVLDGASISIEDFRFGEVQKSDGTTANGLLILVGIGAEYAALDFGGGVKIQTYDLLGAFEIGLALPFSWDGITTTGRFLIKVGRLEAIIPVTQRFPVLFYGLDQVLPFLNPGLITAAIIDYFFIERFQKSSFTQDGLLHSIASPQTLHLDITILAEEFKGEEIFPLRPADMDGTNLSFARAQQCKSVIFHGRHVPEASGQESEGLVKIS